jgi:hypothetical protein
MQSLCNVTQTNGWVIGVCYVTGFFILLPLLVIPPYVQSGLNSVWRLYPPAEEEGEVHLTAPPPTAEAGPTAPPPDASQRLG